MRRHHQNHFINTAVNELNTEDLPAGGHKRTRKIQYPMPNIESKGPGRTFPIRFAHKFGKLSASAKRGKSTQIYRGCDAVSPKISVRVRPKRFVPRCPVVRTLQTTQWRMDGERAIQLWVVRPVFRALPFLASVAGPAAAANFNFEIKFSSACNCDHCSAVAAADSSF